MDGKLNKEALYDDSNLQTIDDLFPNSSIHSFGRRSDIDLESLHQIHSDASSGHLTIAGGKRNKAVASSCKAIGTNADDLPTSECSQLFRDISFVDYITK